MSLVEGSSEGTAPPGWWMMTRGLALRASGAVVTPYMVVWIAEGWLSGSVTLKVDGMGCKPRVDVVMISWVDSFDAEFLDSQSQGRDMADDGKVDVL